MYPAVICTARGPVPAVICTLPLYVLPEGQFLLLYVPCCYMYPAVICTARGPVPAVICTLLLYVPCCYNYVLPDGQSLLLYVPCCYMYCQTASPCCYMYWSRPWLWPWHSQGQFEPLCVAKSLPIYAKSYNLTGELIGRETVRAGGGGGEQILLSAVLSVGH